MLNRNCAIRRLQRLWPAVFLWAVVAAMVWGDNLSWQKIVVAPGYWFLQTIAVYYLLFYWLGNMVIRFEGGVFKGVVPIFRGTFRGYCITPSSRVGLDVPYPMALCMPL